jgi:SET domain-containing protein
MSGTRSIKTVSRRKRLRKKNELPHHAVYVRIRPSRVHGVGVFAIRSIRKGTNIFRGDDGEIVWVRKNQVKGLPKELKRLYEDFCIIKQKGKLYGCPKSFNILTVAWYLNESKSPNVYCDANYDFFALRDIRPGEELTVDYSTYNEFQ